MFEIHRGSPDQRRTFYWRLVARNGEVLAHSEQYESEPACRKGIRAARVAALIGRVRRSY